MRIYTKGLILKEAYVTVTLGCETNYYYSSSGLIHGLKHLGVDISEILKILMKIRGKENKFLFKGVSFFAMEDRLLKTKLINNKRERYK